jgi:hypothetical protein
MLLFSLIDARKYSAYDVLRLQSFSVAGEQGFFYRLRFLVYRLWMAVDWLM